MADEFNELDLLIDRARQAGASDLHLVPAMRPQVRVDGELRPLDDLVLGADDTELLARLAMGDAYERISSCGEADLSGTYAGDVRCRLNIFRADGGTCLAIRLLAASIPDLGTLGLPPIAQEIPSYHKGLVLVCGETGSGKSTTLAATIDRINHDRAEHIITLEDPIEYVYQSDRSLISQREIGRDTASFAEGLRAILREDPDVVLVGEMRDLDTIETALTAAETGHLVFGTLHTKSAADAVDRLVDVFPEGRQRQIRLQLSMTLVVVLSQQLLPRRGGGRVLACEAMVVNDAIRNLIREAKTPQIQSTIQTTAELGSQTMNNALLQLLRTGQIDRQVALEASSDREDLQRMIR